MSLNVLYYYYTDEVFFLGEKLWQKLNLKEQRLHLLVANANAEIMKLAKIHKNIQTD